MAIKRIDPKATIKLVSTLDDAIDKEGSPYIIDENLKKIHLKTIEENPELADQEQFKEPGKILKYLRTYDLNDLVFKPTEKPTYFIVKNLPVDTQTQLFAKYIKTDTVNKTSGFSDMFMLFVDLFKTCCTQVEDDGVVAPVQVNEVPANVVHDIGGIIFNRAQLGPEQKKN